jgi:hypothetical protein
MTSDNKRKAPTSTSSEDEVGSIVYTFDIFANLSFYVLPAQEQEDSCRHGPFVCVFFANLHFRERVSGPFVFVIVLVADIRSSSDTVRLDRSRG